jgi:hypothetical protein
MLQSNGSRKAKHASRQSVLARNADRQKAIPVPSEGVNEHKMIFLIIFACVCILGCFVPMQTRLDLPMQTSAEASLVPCTE